MKRFALLALSVVLLLGLGCRGPGKAPRTLVLGFDGMDPTLLRQFMAQGEMPNFARLASEGSFLELATTDPPQSPVAWSTFITGRDPRGHGVFDFVHRDPKTLRAIPSLNAVEDGVSRMMREGAPFWRYLEEAGVPARLVKLPANFPALEHSGTYLTDMGTPDLEGTYGTYSFYTDAPPAAAFPSPSGGRRVQVEVRDGVVKASLVGPSVAEVAESLPFEVAVDGQAALVEIGEERSLLKSGEWSPWIPVRFPSAPGMVRVYLKSLQPFALYVSPLNIDPGNPAVPVSYPSNYAELLCQECGRFYTQGMPEETAALLDGLFDDDDFLKQNALVVDERKRLFSAELARFDQGLFFFYVSSTDILSHLYWNTIDPQHPGYSSKRAERYKSVILDSYKLADAFLGQALEAVPGDTTVVALSDHGFAPFRRSFNLNAWLRSEGYQQGEGSALAGLDWKATTVYGVGFNGLYLNLAGREAQGVVAEGDRAALLEGLAAKLLRVRDPKTGALVVAKAEILAPPDDPSLRAQCPDMLVGYARGYRASWETALGDSSDQVLADNLQAWSGDHLISPDLVPGVLLSNRKVTSTSVHLRDLAPSLLKLYGVDPSPDGGGRPFW